jgi:hypothetical protein
MSWGFFIPQSNGDFSMTHQDIIAHLCQLYPPQIIHEITTEHIISAIVRRMGKKALDLSVEDLELARDEVRQMPPCSTFQGSPGNSESTATI